ncbi:MAG: ribonucleoside hydrolase RihC [Clostridia bacterium]|jgi:non-specific riboncleoside hydrolase|nr:ribonucleoside hydrolase RihC [Clostridia bacterium]
MNKEKIKKVIIDTDPGVDDAACLVYALFDKSIDIKLITTVSGNISVEKNTRNMLHILDKFGVDIPVAKGCAKAMNRISPYAEHIHSVEGLGGYIPPVSVSRPLHELDAVEAMYKVLSEGDGDIEILLLGPQTNMGTLLQRHPDIIKKIPNIIFMGGCPYGIEGYPKHISFNISSDPEAFKIVLESGIPLTMVPSDLGRNKAHLDEEFVIEKIKNVNAVGNFIFQMYDKYWEPGYPDKRVATNDTCAYIYFVAPELFTTQKVDMDVDLVEAPGKTIIEFKEDGKYDFVTGVNRKGFLDFLYTKLRDFDNFDLK